MTQPALSACICTRNRPDDLRRCLRALVEAGDGGPDEVVVSDDSPAGSAEEAASRDAACQFPGVLYRTGPRRGLGPNRNACLARAQGTHLCFFDDDVVVPPEFWPAARHLLASAQPRDIPTGYEVKHDAGRSYKVTPHNIDFWGLQRVPPHNGTIRAVVINACIWPAALFTEAGGFDDLLRYGSEEVDMAQRAAWQGFRILYNEMLWVNHYPSLAGRDGYAILAHASRLYATAKAYREYERRPLKALAYQVLAPLQLLGSASRRGNAPAAAKAVGLSWSYARAHRAGSVR